MADLTPPALNDASPFADIRGDHVAVRTPDFEIAKRWYVETLDLRVVAEWDYADQRLGYPAPPADDHLCVEILGGGEPVPQDVRLYSDLGGNLAFAGYHHLCLSVLNVAETLEELRARRDHRGRVIGGRSNRPQTRFVADPFGNLIELAEVLASSPPRTPSKQTAKRG